MRTNISITEYRYIITLHLHHSPKEITLITFTFTTSNISKHKKNLVAGIACFHIFTYMGGGGRNYPVCIAWRDFKTEACKMSSDADVACSVYVKFLPLDVRKRYREKKYHFSRNNESKYRHKNLRKTWKENNSRERTGITSGSIYITMFARKCYACLISSPSKALQLR